MTGANTVVIDRPALPVHQQFAIAVVSFPHSLTAERLGRANAAWGSIWKSWLTRLDDSSLEHAIDDSWFFLPYVRRFLFPEFARHPQHSPQARLAAAKGFRGRALPELFADFQHSAVLRLTLSDACLGPLRELHVSATPTGGPVPPNCWLDWVDLALFPGGVGSLMLRFSLLNPTRERDRQGASALTTSDVADRLSQMKWIHPPRLRAPIAEWRLCSSESGDRRTGARELVDFLLQGLSESPHAELLPLEPDPLRWLDSLSTTSRARFSESDVGETFVDRFTFYSYSSLEERVADLARNRLPSAETSAGFGSRFDQALYELMCARDSSRPEYALSSTGVEQLTDRSFYSVWRNWTAAFYDGNVAYLSAEDSRFVRDALPATVEGDYLYLYLLVHLQRTWMRTMLGELQRPGALLRGDLRASRDLWRRHIEFRSAFSFREVTSRPNGQSLHRRITETTGVEELLSELSEEIQLLQEHAETLVQHREAAAERRTASLLGFIGFVGLPLSILADLYDYDSLFGQRSWPHLIAVAGVLLFACVVAWFAVGLVAGWYRNAHPPE